MFRFSIPEILLLTLGAALGLGWWGHWQQLRRVNYLLNEEKNQWERRAAILKGGCEIEGYRVAWTSESDSIGVEMVRVADPPNRVLNPYAAKFTSP